MTLILVSKIHDDISKNMAARGRASFPYILREKSLATYFRDSQFRRTITCNIMISKIYVDKRLRVRWHYLLDISHESMSGLKSPVQTAFFEIARTVCY